MTIVQLRLTSSIEPPDDQLRNIGLDLASEADRVARETLSEPVEVVVDFEEGSLHTILDVFLGVKAVVDLAVLYDSYWSALERIAAQARVLADRVRAYARDRTGAKQKGRVTTGDVGRIESVFKQVGEGVMSPENGVIAAVRILKRAGIPTNDQMEAELLAKLKRRFPGYRMKRPALRADRGPMGAGRTKPARRRRLRVVKRLEEDAPHVERVGGDDGG